MGTLTSVGDLHLCWTLRLRSRSVKIHLSSFRKVFSYDNSDAKKFVGKLTGKLKTWIVSKQQIEYDKHKIFILKIQKVPFQAAFCFYYSQKTLKSIINYIANVVLLTSFKSISRQGKIVNRENWSRINGFSQIYPPNSHDLIKHSSREAKQKKTFIFYSKPPSQLWFPQNSSRAKETFQLKPEIFAVRTAKLASF